MKHTYRVHLQPQPHRLLSNGAPFSAAALVSAVEGAVLREVVQGSNGRYEIDLQLQRRSHEQALNDILVAAQQLGYSWVQATVTEWADNAVSGLVLGGLGGAAGGTSTGSGEVAAMLALVGAVVGAVVGSFIASVKVMYEAHWTPTGWQLVALQPAPAAPAPLGFA